MSLAEEMREIARKVQPTADRLFVRLDRNSRKVGSIILPGNSREKLDLIVSEVLARGPDVRLKPWELAVGDYVLHIRTVALKYDGVLGRLGRGNGGVDSDYAFIYEKDAIAVVDPNALVEGQANMTEGRLGEWHQ